MPIKILTRSETIAEGVRQAGFEAIFGPKDISTYMPSVEKKTYYVFNTNSLGDVDYYFPPSNFFATCIKNFCIKSFFDTCIGNLDYRRNLFGKPYLPIGSCLVFDMDEAAMAHMVTKLGFTPSCKPVADTFSKAPKGVVVTPITLCASTIKEDISKTRNIFYATQAVLYAILVQRKHSIEEVDIVLSTTMPSLSFILPTMPEEEILRQMMDAINHYSDFVPDRCGYDFILREPNLLEQPPTYMNTAFFSVAPGDLIYL